MTLLPWYYIYNMINSTQFIVLHIQKIRKEKGDALTFCRALGGSLLSDGPPTVPIRIRIWFLSTDSPSMMNSLRMMKSVKTNNIQNQYILYLQFVHIVNSNYLSLW